MIDNLIKECVALAKYLDLDTNINVNYDPFYKRSFITSVSYKTNYNPWSAKSMPIMNFYHPERAYIEHGETLDDSLNNLKIALIKGAKLNIKNSEFKIQKIKQSADDLEKFISEFEIIENNSDKGAD